MKKQTIGLFLALSLTILVSCGEKKGEEKKEEKKVEETTDKKADEKTEEKSEEKTKKGDSEEDIRKKLMGKWQQTKVENNIEGMQEQHKAGGYIIFKETTFEEYNGIEGAEIPKGKWGLVKLSKDKMEQIRQNKEPTPIMGIRFREPIPEDPDYCEYRLISVSEDELVLVPQIGFTTNYYKKVK